MVVGGYRDKPLGFVRRQRAGIIVKHDRLVDTHPLQVVLCLQIVDDKLK